MEKIFIRERINIINYKNENQGLIYTSSDENIDGGAVNVQLEAGVGGWYQLTFDMPSYIWVEGKPVSNPYLKNLFPLAKLQYTRVIKEGDEEEELILYFIVQPQIGSRDDAGIVLQNFTCIDYPRHILSKAKNGITIGDDTIDEELSLTPNNEVPEVEGDSYWIKAPVQSRTNFNSFDEVVLWGDAKPGAFAYVPSTGKAYRLIGTDVDYYTVNADGTKNYENWHELDENQTYSVVDGEITPEPVWCPDWEGYPLEPDVNNYEWGNIDINDLDSISVQFYWDTVWFEPDKLMGRYDGTVYEEDSRLTYSVYETLDFDFPESFMGSYFKAENLREDVPTQIEGATAFNFIPYLVPCLVTSGLSNFISFIVGLATPYPVVFTILRAVLNCSYSVFDSLYSWNIDNKLALLEISISIISFKTCSNNSSGASNVIVIIPVFGSTSDI